MFLTYLTLLIPAFSLLYTPTLFTQRLRCVENAPLPLPPKVESHSFGDRLSPAGLFAQHHSTSELLRTL
jgi:hypothetical protein